MVWKDSQDDLVSNEGIYASKYYKIQKNSCFSQENTLKVNTLVETVSVRLVGWVCQVQ